MNSPSLIDRITAHLRERGESPTPTPMPPAEVSLYEERLGFRLPQTLRLLYTEIGDGGFGPPSPCHGIFPLAQATREYQECLTNREYIHPEWPEKLLPIYDWGCAITSHVDCSNPLGPVIRVDPNTDPDWMATTFFLPDDFPFFWPCTNNEIAAWVEAPSLEDWLERWLRGEDLGSTAYPNGRPRP